MSILRPQPDPDGCAPVHDTHGPAFSDPLQTAVVQRGQQTLARREFVPNAPPRVNTAAGEVACAEALLAAWQVAGLPRAVSVILGESPGWAQARPALAAWAAWGSATPTFGWRPTLLSEAETT